MVLSMKAGDAVSHRLKSINAIAKMANHIASGSDYSVYKDEIQQALQTIIVMGEEVSNLLESIDSEDLKSVLNNIE